MIGGVFVGAGSVLDLWLVWMFFCFCLVFGGWLDSRHLFGGWYVGIGLSDWAHRGVYWFSVD